jgi:hypothetical protein
MSAKSFAEFMSEDRRLIILRALDEYGFSGNETVLKQAIETFGHHPTRDMVRADLMYLDEHGLVRLEKIAAQSGELWITHLLNAGQEVAKGRHYPGVARREPG